MVARVKRIPPALKHAGFCATGLLPGEDRAAFENLREDLITELCPDGPLESQTVATIARLTWRKQNLYMFRIAAAAQQRYATIRIENVPAAKDFDVPSLLGENPPDPAELQAGIKAAEAQAREELGDSYPLVEMGEAATIPKMLEDFAVEERLDGMIDRCLKRLLFLRGLKSLQPAQSMRRITGPGKAA